MKKSSAFTIIELSAVLVVIGILILGITKGVSLVEGSRIKSAQSFTIKSPVADT
jgi:prepilin-type N-terminal cleavage/methylation domain-containing protein